MIQLVILIQAASTWAMVGLIWFVQVVHYPLMGQVGAEYFQDYELKHQQLTTWVVAPLMLLVIGTAFWLCYARPATLAPWIAYTGAALLLVIWASTFLVQVPTHEALSAQFSSEQHALLVKTNWLRTVAWSARGVLVLMMLSAR